VLRSNVDVMVADVEKPGHEPLWNVPDPYVPQFARFRLLVPTGLSRVSFTMSPDLLHLLGRRLLISGLTSGRLSVRRKPKVEGVGPSNCKMQTTHDNKRCKY